MNQQTTLAPFFVIGISVRTSNNGPSATDIPALWDRFRTEDLAGQISGIISNDVYSIYTDYEGDYTQPYTTILGFKVANLDEIPDGMRGISIEGGNYVKRTAKGNLLAGVVFEAWVNIWNSELPRAYTADFEVYGAKASNPEDAEVEIYIATV